MNDQLHDFASLGIAVRLLKIAGFDAKNRPLLVGEDAPALSLVPLDESMSDQVAAVTQVFNDDVCTYLILGVVQIPGGERNVEISAERELSLRCGKSSLSLSADGRVTLRGKQILSRADGQNRVQGATVDLN